MKTGHSSGHLPIKRLMLIAEKLIETQGAEMARKNSTGPLLAAVEAVLTKKAGE